MLISWSNKLLIGWSNNCYTWLCIIWYQKGRLLVHQGLLWLPLAESPSTSRNGVCLYPSFFFWKFSENFLTPLDALVTPRFLPSFSPCLILSLMVTNSAKPDAQFPIIFSKEGDCNVSMNMLVISFSDKRGYTCAISSL